MFLDEILSKYPDIYIPDAVFKIQNVVDYLLSHLDTENNKLFPSSVFSFKLPFNKIAFEFTIQRFNGYHEDVAILAREQNINKSLSLLEVTYFVKVNFIKYLHLSIYYLLIDKNGNVVRWNEQYGKQIFPDRPEIRGNALMLIIPIDVKMSKDNNMSPASYSAGFNAVLGLALNFLHCKNVHSIENPHQLIRAARRRGETTYFEKYYILQIEPMKKILNEQGQAQTKGLKYALHICRGHFKTYDRKGLFGKYKGNFWWSSMVKGDPTIGKIKKDYQINV